MTHPPLRLVNLQLPQVPQDKVRLSYEIDKSRCASITPPILAQLQYLENNGLEVSIAQIVAHSAILYRGGVADATPEAELRGAWAELSNWNPRQEKGRDNTDRLVVDHQRNAATQNRRCELLGIGVGLLTAIELYGIDYNLWRATTRNERHDLEAPLPADGGMVKVEARGRYMRRGWKQAIAQVHSKFSVGDFSQAAGAVYAPRHTANPRAADVCIVDPPGSQHGGPRYSGYRAMLKHYASFFARQGGALGGFADRLLRISELDDGLFENYLSEGDGELRNNPRLRRARTHVRVRGARFSGTAWDGVVWPSHLTGSDEDFRNGVFYWGLWDRVTVALSDGRLQELAGMCVEPTVSRLDGKVLVVLSDGTALAWAPTRDGLCPGMFDGAYRGGDRDTE